MSEKKREKRNPSKYHEIRVSRKTTIQWNELFSCKNNSKGDIPYMKRKRQTEETWECTEGRYSTQMYHSLQQRLVLMILWNQRSVQSFKGLDREAETILSTDLQSFPNIPMQEVSFVLLPDSLTIFYSRIHLFLVDSKDNLLYVVFKNLRHFSSLLHSLVC